MSTYNTCFHGEIWQIVGGYHLLSGAMGSRLDVNDSQIKRLLYDLHAEFEFGGCQISEFDQLYFIINQCV